MLGLIGLLECYNTYDQDDIYFNIAREILKNYNKLNISSVQEFADSLHISVSTAQRFIKQLYFNNFSTFKFNYINSSENYQYDGKYFEKFGEGPVSPKEYGRIITDRVTEVMNSLDEAIIDNFIKMIKDSEEIIFIGIPMTSEVWRLQVELVLMGKRTSAFIDPNYQIKSINNSGEKALVVCIQYMRQEDNHNEELLKLAKDKGAKTVCITHIKKKSIENIADLALVYKGNNTQMDSMLMGLILNYIGSKLACVVD